MRAAKSAVTTTTLNHLHLIIVYGSNGPVLTVSTTPVRGCITMTRRDYLKFRFYMLQIFRVIIQGSIQTKDENPTNTPYEKIARNADVFKEIALYFYAHIAKLVAPGLSEHDQLERTAQALYASNSIVPASYYQTLQRPLGCSNPHFNVADPATWSMPGRAFFDMSVVQRVTASSHQSLLNLALNAVRDLEEIKRIIDNTRPEERSILLSAKGTATITHLEALNPGYSFKRTGTALQMAIYGDDEGVQALLKEYMDPEEFEHQAIEAFSTLLPLDVKQRLAEKGASAAEYSQAAEAQQKQDAINLCAELFGAMRAAAPAEFIRTGSASTITTSESVAAVVVKFKQGLLDYTQKNPLHNRYILERLYEINALLEERSYCFHRDCFLSQEGIAEAQLLMSERWVQHYWFGLSDIEKGDECALRTFECRCIASVAFDIHQTMSRLRSHDQCLSTAVHLDYRSRTTPCVAWRVQNFTPAGEKLQRHPWFSIKACVKLKQDAIRDCYAASPSKCPQA